MIRTSPGISCKICLTNVPVLYLELLLKRILSLGKGVVIKLLSGVKVGEQ